MDPTFRQQLHDSRKDDPSDLPLHPDLRGQEQIWLSALLQATDCGILLCDNERQDVVANRKLGELLAVSPHQLVNSSPEISRATALDSFADPAMFEQRLREIYADPALSCSEELALTGEPARTVRRFTAPVAGPGETLLGRVWTFLDISETKRLQAMLEEQLSARTDDLEATAAVLRVVHQLGKLSQQDLSERELLHRISEVLEALLGHDVCAVMLGREGKDRRGVAHRHGQALELGGPESSILETLLRMAGLAPGGSGRETDAFGVALFAIVDGGTTVGTLIFLRSTPPFEIDPHRIAHLASIAEHVGLALEAHRLQRQLHVTFAALQAAQQQIVAAERLRTAGMLATTIAHDIKNILTPLELDLMRLEMPEMSRVREHLQRFATLTHRLLSFARPAAAAHQATDLHEVVQCVLDWMAPHAGLHQVRLIADVPESLPPAGADPRLLEQLLVNLCLNAVQAMADDGGELRIMGAAKGDALWLEVTDSGTGVLPEHLPYLFDPFFTTRTTGVGLGLYSCRRIVEECGGTIQATSRLGCGTTFRIRLTPYREETAIGACAVSG